MLDQLIIGDKNSVEDFDASLKERAISAPEKKSIKETVPFSNITYDFSAINGELYWNERELEYVFEIIAMNPEELERKKARFSNWVMNVMNECIYDPFDPDWHYLGTFDSIDYADEECVEKTTITVRFTVYPYKVANNLTVFDFVLPAGASIEKVVTNQSSHRITPTFTAGAALTLQIGSRTYALAKGTTTDASFKLEPGETVMSVTNSGSASCELTVEFHCEVF